MSTDRAALVAAIDRVIEAELGLPRPGVREIAWPDCESEVVDGRVALDALLALLPDGDGAWVPAATLAKVRALIETDAERERIRLLLTHGELGLGEARMWQAFDEACNRADAAIVALSDEDRRRLGAGDG